MDASGSSLPGTVMCYNYLNFFQYFWFLMTARRRMHFPNDPTELKILHREGWMQSLRSDSVLAE